MKRLGNLSVGVDAVHFQTTSRALPSRGLIHVATTLVFSFIALLCTACKVSQSVQSQRDKRQAMMDAYCADRGKEDLNDGEHLTRVEAFYSWKIHTCVQVEVGGSDTYWSYDLRDVSDGFFRGKQTVKSEIPLRVYADEHFGIASAQGY